MLKALIVDDEPLAHDVLLHHLQKQEDIQVVGQCNCAVSALQWLANNQADLVFLDINMPQLNGIEMLKLMGNRPQVIIVSAYQDYALEGFELEVCDYLLKPVSIQRFEQALQKIRRNLAKSFTQPIEDAIVLKVDRDMQKFKLQDICYFEGYGNYVKVWQHNQYVLVSSTLKQIATELPKEMFTQVHKSFVVNNSRVKRVGSEFITMDTNQPLRIGKTFKADASNLL